MRACVGQTTCGRHARPAREAGRNARRGRGSHPPSGKREPTVDTPGRAPTGAQLLAFERKGWVAQRGLFTPEEVAGYRYAFLGPIHVVGQWVLHFQGRCGSPFPLYRRAPTKAWLCDLPVLARCLDWILS
jgi:hypothetical protein